MTESLSPLQRALLDNVSCVRLFAVVSWGAAATKWLAKALNSHPDMLCLHAGTNALSRFGPGIDSRQYYHALSVLAHGYRAVGDVHGIARHHIPALKEAFGDRFNAVVLVREPVARVRSLMALFEQFRGLDGWNLSYVEEMIETKQLRLPPGEESRMFVHAANMLNAIAEEKVVGRVYKTEDLTSSAETLAALVRDVSGGDIEPAAEWLASCLRSPRVNVHSTRQEWLPSDWQLEVLRAVVTDDAWSMYEELGYPVPSFA